MPPLPSRPRRALRRSLSATVASAVAASLLLVPSAASAAGPTARDIDSACPPGHVPSAGFRDTPGSTFEDEIDCIVGYRLARGTTADTFDRLAPVTRGQMASFLANTLVAAGRSRPSDLPDAFRDDDGNPHEPSIDWLAAEGVVGGFGDGTYGPALPVSRAQMATFLNNTLREITGARASTTADHFADDDGNPHEANINGLGARGIVTGTGGDAYSPGAPVTRQQMAGFLAREVDLLVDGGHVAMPFGPRALAITPTTAERRDVSDAASAASADRGSRTYAVDVPLGVDRIELALLPAENVSVTSSGSPRFTSNAPTAANAGTSIESVDGVTVDTAGGATDTVRLSDVAVRNGRVLVEVDSTTANAIVPVAWQDTVEPTRDALELEAGAGRSTPKPAREPVAVGGAVGWGPPEPARNTNLSTGTVRQVNAATGWYTLDTGGTAAPEHLLRFSRTDAFRYTASSEPAANSPGPIDPNEFTAWLSVGDRVDPSAYTPGTMTHVIVGDVPAAPTGATATAQEDGRVRVSFTKPTNPVADDVTASFRIERAPVTSSAVGTFAEVGSLNGGATAAFTDAPSSTGRYAYRVVSRSTTGSSPASTATQATVAAPAPATTASQVTDHDPSGSTPPSGLLDHRDTIRLTFDRTVDVDSGWELVVVDADGTVARIHRGPSSGRIAAVQVSGTTSNVVTITMDVTAPTIVHPGTQPGVALGGGFLQVVSTTDIGNGTGAWNLPRSGLSASPHLNTRVLSGRASTPGAPVVASARSSTRTVELGVDEVQTISATPATGGTWTITFDGQTTEALAHDADAAVVADALQALSTVGAGNVQVTGTGSPARAPFTVRFAGDLAGRNVDPLTTASVDLSGDATPPTVATTTEGVTPDGVVAGDTVRVYTLGGTLVGSRTAGPNGRTSVSTGATSNGQTLLVVVEQATSRRHSVTRAVTVTA